MKVGDLVQVKDPARLALGLNEVKAQRLYPWKFEVGMVTNIEPYGSFPGKEVYVHFPSYPEKTILCSAIEVISESW
tara:strand:+ start:220 stop:447 length:228 start_codon:yes stop_codon:yes gene_type:complete